MAVGWRVQRNHKYNGGIRSYNVRIVLSSCTFGVDKVKLALALHRTLKGDDSFLVNDRLQLAGGSVAQVHVVAIHCKVRWWCDAQGVR